MRSAKVGDYWKNVQRRNYEFYIENVTLNGVGGFQKLDLSNGIFAICGLNGAGKSTIISSLKDILGLKINTQDLKKLNGEIVEAQIVNRGSSIVSRNTESERFLTVSELDTMYYIDYKLAVDTLEFLDQENLDELLEQYDSNIFDSEMLQEIQYIVGKKYDNVTLIEIDEGDQTIPYFRVKVDTLEYNSLSMGIGEHFLFYVYWIFSKIKTSGIVLIEEPETFISVISQSRLMNFIAKKVSEVGLNVIITTHSPHIIKNIRKENICIVSRFSNNVTVTRPTVDRESLVSLGLEIPKRGCIFVEDFVGELFLKAVISRNFIHILREFNIERLKGESEITTRLQFPFSNHFTYKIIGVYDGDMKEKLSSAVRSKLNWKFSFLPTTVAVEEEFEKCIRENYLQLCEALNVTEDDMIRTLSIIDGEDHHDWLIDFALLLGKDIVVLFEAIFDIWMERDENEVQLNQFIAELKELCL